MHGTTMRIAILRSVKLLHCVCYVVLLKLFSFSNTTPIFFPRGGRILASPGLDSP